MKLRYPPLASLSIGEPDANSEFFSALRTGARPIFLDCFYLLPHFPIKEFASGEKYILYGQKGTGKTSILRHLQDQLPANTDSEFLIFKKSFLEEIDIQEFSKLPLMLDEEQIKAFKHYHHTVKRIIVMVLINKLLFGPLHDDDLEGITDSESKSLIKRVASSSVGDAIKFAFDSISSIFSSVGVDITKASSGNLLVDGSKLLKRNNDDLLSFFVKKFKKTNKPLRLFLDEIHFAYRSAESLQQDAILVRDTILATQSLNDRFAQEGINVIIYVAIRSEYLDHPLISTADVNQSIESVGQELTYSNFRLNRSHPLFDLIFTRFKRSITDGLTKDQFFRVYLSGIEPLTFLQRTWGKPRDFVRYFKCAKKLYPGKCSLTDSEANAVWRNYSQEAWKELKSAASPFMCPEALSLFEDTLARIAPSIFDGSLSLNVESFGTLFKPTYEIAKGNNKNFYDFNHFIRLLYILGIFGTRQRDALRQDIYHSYHRGNRNYHANGSVLIHPAVLKAFG